MKNIACVFSFTESTWVSCQKIVFNLHQCYEKCPDVKISNFNYSENLKEEEIFFLAKNIAQLKPDVISIIDHKPHPFKLIEFLYKRYYKGQTNDKKKGEETEIKPKFIIHLFGDFSLYYSEWKKSAEFLEYFEVEFVAASDRQKILVDKFIKPHLKSHICPFPINEKEFHFKHDLRDQQRSFWGLKRDEVAYVFTGRLSRQKRIHQLINTFSKFIQSHNNTKAHLFLYGNFDNIGDHFVGIWETEGEYFRKVNRLYRSLPSKVQKRIHFMGAVPNNELKAVYHGADYLVNFSVHNDEDYGMSVAEALSCGLPVILTDWGGLSSFNKVGIEGATHYIPVKIGKRGKLIQTQKAEEILTTTYQENWAKDSQSYKEKRNALSLKTHQLFGINANSSIIKNLITSQSKKFNKFSPLLERVITAQSFNNTPYITDRKVINHLYREIYSSYVKPH